MNSSTSIKKMQTKPMASHTVKGEPSTSVLMMAAVTAVSYTHLTLPTTPYV